MTLLEVELAVGAGGLLQTFNEAGVLDVSDIRVADRICFLGKESDERVALAVALLVRGLRGGSVCIELANIASDIDVDDVPWPDVAGWLAAVRDSALLGQVLHLYDERLLYLDRYWREEKQVCDDLLALQVSKPSRRSARLRATFSLRIRRAARSRGNRSVASGHGADRRPRNR